MALDPYWDWFDEVLKAERRAVGGEPCLICTEPIAATAHPTQRDRHVCSPRCNDLLRRRLKRKIARGEVAGYQPSAQAIARAITRASRPAQTFRTVRDAEFPYEHSWFPIAGDVVERHGVVNKFVTFGQLPWVPNHLMSVMTDARLSEGQVLGVLCPQARVWTVHFTAEGGEPLSLSMGEVYSCDEQVSRSRDRFELPDLGLYQWIEFISDVDATGSEYRWQATLFSPIMLQNLWTPARMALSQKRSRVTRAKNAYQARMRALGVIDADAAEVDPLEVYERDQFVCQLCERPIDRNAAWPDPLSITLDHIRPVTRGGQHIIHNLQAAHWICNVQKGNRA